MAAAEGVMEKGHRQSKRRSKEKAWWEVEGWHQSHPTQSLKTGLKTLLLSHASLQSLVSISHGSMGGIQV